MNNQKGFTGFFGTAGIWIIFLLIVVIAILAIIGYWFFYRISINKSLHSDMPKKRVPPKNIIIAVLGVLFALSVGFSVQRITQDYKNQSTSPREYFNYFYENTRGAAFDTLFDDNDLAEEGGYLLRSWQENGFEVRELTGGRATSSLMPDNIIRIRYIDELPTLTEGEHLDFSFAFLYRNAERSDGKFIGHGSTGSYKQIYITYNCLGKYDIKMTAELRVRINKTDNVEPFAKILYEIGVLQS